MLQENEETAPNRGNGNFGEHRIFRRIKLFCLSVFHQLWLIITRMKLSVTNTLDKIISVGG